jgi:hypothetical protein
MYEHQYLALAILNWEPSAFAHDAGALLFVSMTTPIPSDQPKIASKVIDQNIPYFGAFTLSIN